MNIETITQNLRNLIEIKEATLALCSEREFIAVYPKTLEYKGICDTLETNIDELKCILHDVALIQHSEMSC